MIKPTVGRVVWVIRPTDTLDIKQPEVGLVTYVHDDRSINVAGFNQNGTPFSLTSLWLAQDDDEAKPEGNFACWMPYQKGQAAKAEQLEKQVADAAPVTDSAIEREIQAKGLTAPRVTPTGIESVIGGEYYFTAEQGADRGSHANTPIVGEQRQALSLLTICVLVLDNGFTVIGESACASPQNFDAELGRKLARARAVNKIWPLEGYLLKQRLSETSHHAV